MFRRDWTWPSNYFTTPHLTMNMIGMIYVYSQGIIKHALPITISKSCQVQFSNQFWLMLHCRFAMQHKYCSTHLIGRSWRTCKTSRITLTYLRWHRISYIYVGQKAQIARPSVQDTIVFNSLKPLRSSAGPAAF